MDSAEAGQSGATKNVSENGFRLVVRGVGDGYLGGVSVFDQLGEKCVAGAARGILEVGFVSLGLCGDVRPRNVKWQRVLRGQLRDEFLVGVRGAAAQLVIEV